MNAPFPSLDYFTQLQKSLSQHPESAADAPPSEAYCGLSIDGQLFVLEFDGRECAAVVAGGNPLDLDFVLSGTNANWQQALGGARSLAELVDSDTLQVESEADDGQELARGALPMLQAFIAQAPNLD
jgi:hypothetical protein